MIRKILEAILYYVARKSPTGGIIIIPSPNRILYA